MKTIATMALLLGTIAVGIAPAAEAHETRLHGNTAQRNWDRGNDHRPGFLPQAHERRRAGEIRRLAAVLERTTDELGRDARRAAGRVNRFEARAVQAVYRLEEAADRFQREVGRRGPLEARELHRELRAVNVAFRDAHRGSHALRHSPELRRDFARVGNVLDQLDDAFEPGHRVAWNDGRFHAGRR
jgi:hypothetical protein